MSVMWVLVAAGMMTLPGMGPVPHAEVVTFNSQKECEAARKDGDAQILARAKEINLKQFGSACVPVQVKNVSQTDA